MTNRPLEARADLPTFTCLDQFLCMAFAQLTFRESLRDIEACLRAHQDKLYHMGIRGGMSRNTLANANQRRYSHPADKTTGVRCDQTVVPSGAKGRKHYPQPLRRIKYQDAGTDKTFNFLTHHFSVSAPTVAALYRYRWQVELFFK